MLDRIAGGCEAFPELLIEKDDYDFTVTTSLGRKLLREETLSLLGKHPGAGAPAHLYFHLPFCSCLCRYCNYVKKRLPKGPEGQETLDRWTDALIHESSLYLKAAPWLREARIESVYFGGGTAALLNYHQLRRLLTHLRQNYALAHDCEISLEGNPENFLKDEVVAATALGFNRFSLGIQSFDDRVTQFAGRAHDRQTSTIALDNIRKSGRPFNVDLIYGLPLQSFSSVTRDIRILLGYETPQITVYRLRNADRQHLGIAGQALWNLSHFNSQFREEKAFPGLQAVFRMRAEIMQILLASGYSPGPCAWWSRRGTYPQDIPTVSRNKWWQMDTMVGFGPGAYGWLTGGRSSILQLHHSVDIEQHARLAEGTSPPLVSGRLVSGGDALTVAMGFNFKAFKPISRERYLRQFGVDPVEVEPYRHVIDGMMRRGFLEFSADRKYLLPTMLGEAFHEEILKVYFNDWMARALPPAGFATT